MVLIAGRAGLKNDHVVPFILPEAKAPVPGKLDQVVADGLGIPGAVGNGANFFKKAKYAGRLQTGQGMLFHQIHSFMGI